MVSWTCSVSALPETKKKQINKIDIIDKKYIY